MLVFNKKTKIYNFLTKIKTTWGGGFGVGAGGDENLIIDFYWPYSFCVTFQSFTDRSIHILPEICMMELMQKKKIDGLSAFELSNFLPPYSYACILIAAPPRAFL